MIGRINVDLNIVDRQPGIPQFNAPIQNRNELQLPTLTTNKLNGLYNTANMPVLYVQANANQAALAEQTGTINNFLSNILFPKRMPYNSLPVNNTNSPVITRF
jgi:negative regulator of sigma E activity